MDKLFENVHLTEINKDTNFNSNVQLNVHRHVHPILKNDQNKNEVQESTGTYAKPDILEKLAGKVMLHDIALERIEAALLDIKTLLTEGSPGKKKAG